MKGHLEALKILKIRTGFEAFLFISGITER